MNKRLQSQQPMKIITKKGHKSLQYLKAIETRKGIGTLQLEKSATTEINLQPRKTIINKSLDSHKPKINTITM